MTTATTTKDTSDLSQLFIFENFEGEEQQHFLEEVGTLLFQSALMQHLAQVTDIEAERFESFIESHIDSDSFIDVLCLEFPQFEKTLTSEMRAFNSEIKNN